MPVRAGMGSAQDGGEPLITDADAFFAEHEPATLVVDIRQRWLYPDSETGVTVRIVAIVNRSCQCHEIDPLTGAFLDTLRVHADQLLASGRLLSSDEDL